jgi:hypothetical protein
MLGIGTTPHSGLQMALTVYCQTPCQRGHLCLRSGVLFPCFHPVSTVPASSPHVLPLQL